MATKEHQYEDLPDISGSTNHGPKVLKTLREYEHGLLMTWDTNQDCITLATSEKLYSESEIINTLKCIQSKALPDLFGRGRIDLIVCFLRCIDERVRKQTTTLIEKLLFSIPKRPESLVVLRESEISLCEVITYYLRRWRFLTNGIELYFFRIVRLYYMVIAAFARTTLSVEDHGKYEEFVASIKIPKVAKKEMKGLIALEEPLTQLTGVLKIKLKKYNAILTWMEPNSAMSQSPPKDVAPIQILFFVFQKLLETATERNVELLQMAVRSVKASGQMKTIIEDMITHGIVFFLLKYQAEGMLPPDKTYSYSEKMISLLPKDRPRCLSVMDILMFVKNAAVRSQMIEVFLAIDSRSYSYGKDIVNTNIKIIEHLLSQTMPSFRDPADHPYTREWRQCLGQFGNLPVLLNVYIPDQASHKEDIYISDIAMKGQEPFNEVNLLKSLPDHPHIIKLFAHSLDKLPYFYVTENPLNCNLQVTLVNKRNNMEPLPSKQLVTIVVQAISAIEFLHTKGICIVHRDITAASFYLDEGRQLVKLSNLCLANIQSDSQPMHRSKSVYLAARWLSPESSTDLTFSTASDVWMFGCFMYEVLTHGCLPHSDMKATDERIVKLVRGNRKKLSIETCIPPPLWKLIMDCTQHRPEDRPSTSELSRQLTEINNSAEAKTAPSAICSAATLYPFKDRLPANIWTRGLSFKQQSGTKRLLGESDDQSTYLSLGASVSYPNLDGFPSRELICPTSHQGYILMLQKTSLPGIPKFTINREDQGDFIEFEPVEEMVNIYSLWDGPEAINYSLLEVLIPVSSAVSQLHSHGWIHGRLGTDCVWTISRNDQVHIYFSNIQHMVKLQEHNQWVNVAEQTFDKRAAPELIGSGHMSKACDVFSFGFIIWDLAQLLNGRKGLTALSLLSPEEDEEIYDRFKTANEGELLPQPENCPDGLFSIMKECWQSEPSRRPTMDKVQELLQDLFRFTDGPSICSLYSTPRSVIDVEYDTLSELDDQVQTDFASISTSDGSRGKGKPLRGKLGEDVVSSHPTPHKETYEQDIAEYEEVIENSYENYEIPKSRLQTSVTRTQQPPPPSQPPPKKAPSPWGNIDDGYTNM